MNLPLLLRTRAFLEKMLESRLLAARTKAYKKLFRCNLPIMMDIYVLDWSIMVLPFRLNIRCIMNMKGASFSTSIITVKLVP